jgi:hypothetical protein
LFGGGVEAEVEGNILKENKLKQSYIPNITTNN